VDTEMLGGMSVLVWNSDNPGYYGAGIVVAVEKEIGITIISHDKKDYLYCLNGPGAPVRGDGLDLQEYYKERPRLLRVYYKAFKSISEALVYGQVDVPYLRTCTGSASADTCSFA